MQTMKNCFFCSTYITRHKSKISCPQATDAQVHSCAHPKCISALNSPLILTCHPTEQASQMQGLRNCVKWSAHTSTFKKFHWPFRTQQQTLLQNTEKISVC
jgi:hypothetical protein